MLPNIQSLARLLKTQPQRICCIVKVKASLRRNLCHQPLSLSFVPVSIVAMANIDVNLWRASDMHWANTMVSFHVTRLAPTLSVSNLLGPK